LTVAVAYAFIIPSWKILMISLLQVKSAVKSV
jgi:hypothetical protein